jgi:hypothetical protein
MNFIPNLLIIAGTGTKSGKTTFACRIIEQFRELGLVGIKISPHFHDKTSGLLERSSAEGYSIHIETNGGTEKDTSRMLRAGASKVFLALVWDSRLTEVFNKIMEDIPSGTPVVCESPSLRNFIEPGLFIIMTSETENKRQDLNHLQELPHVMFKLEELKDFKKLPVEFRDGKWSEA